ncbi:MAG: hypothetical protein QM796_17055 [Chthoniobacteraceae bacterium]
MPFNFRRIPGGAGWIVLAFVAGFSSVAPWAQPSRRPGPGASNSTALPSGHRARLAGSPVEKIAGLRSGPPSEARFDAVLQTLLQWAATDPQAALDYTRHHFDPRHRSAFLASLLCAWAGREPQAAWQWVKTSLPGDHTQYDAVLFTIGKTNPDLAWQDAVEGKAQIGQKRDISPYVSALRGIIYSGGYEKAAALIDSLSLPADEQKYDLTSVLGGEWARFDPQQAAQWIENEPGDANSFDRQQTLVSLGVSWAQRDPRAAADFAAQLPPGVARQNMLAVALNGWATNHPDEAAQWLNQYPSDPDLDYVVRSLATSPKVIDASPDQALAWANSMTDDDLRLQTLKIIVDRWMTTNYAAAKAYVQNANLPTRIQSVLDTDIQSATP